MAAAAVAAAAAVVPAAATAAAAAAAAALKRCLPWEVGVGVASLVQELQLQVVQAAAQRPPLQHPLLLLLLLLRLHLRLRLRLRRLLPAAPLARQSWRKWT